MFFMPFVCVIGSTKSAGCSHFGKNICARTANNRYIFYVILCSFGGLGVLGGKSSVSLTVGEITDKFNFDTRMRRSGSTKTSTINDHIGDEMR